MNTATPVNANSTLTLLRFFTFGFITVLFVACIYTATNLAFSREFSLLNTINQYSHKEFSQLLKLRLAVDYITSDNIHKESNARLNEIVFNDIKVLIDDLEEIQQTRKAVITELNQFFTFELFDKINPSDFETNNKIEFLRRWLSDYVEQWRSLIESGKLKESSPLQLAFVNQLFIQNYLSKQETIISSKIEKNTNKRRWSTFIFSTLLVAITLYYLLAIVIPSTKRVLKIEREQNLRSQLRSTLIEISRDFARDTTLLNLPMSELADLLCKTIQYRTHLLIKSVGSDMPTVNFKKNNQPSLLLKRQLVVQNWNKRAIENANLVIEFNLPIEFELLKEDVQMFEEYLQTLSYFYSNMKLRSILENERDRYFRYTESAIQALPVALAIFSLDGRLHLRNNRFDDELGLPTEKVSSIKLNDLAGYMFHLYGKEANNFFKEGENKNREMVCDNRIVRWNRFQINELGWILIGNDITQEKEQAKSAEHGKRLETLGKISGGIAHDINNYLAVIMNSVELASITADKEKRQQLLSTTMNACSDAARVNEQLLSYARKQNLINKRISIKDIQENILGFLDQAGRLHDLKYSIGDISYIHADRSHLMSAIFNILKNACEASNQGSFINVSITQVDYGGEAFSSIAIEDNGKGFENASMLKVIEPFFTTKPAGTGLGLSAVHGFASQSNGHLIIENKSKGAKVSLLLPMHEILQSQDIVSAQEQQKESKALLNILVVDDNQSLLKNLATLLTNENYQVFAATGVSSANQIISKSETIDLVISDFILLDGNGFDVVNDTKAKFPQVKIIFISGYLGGSYETMLKDFSAPFLKKPFSHSDLLENIKSLNLHHKAIDVNLN